MNPPRKRSRTFPVWIRRANAAAHAVAPGVTGLPTRPSLRLSSMLGLTGRSSVPSSAALILDPSSSLHSLSGWQACCGDFVVPAQLKPACSSFKANFCSRTGRNPSGGPNQPEMLLTSPRANGHSKAIGLNGRHHPPAGDQAPLPTSSRPPGAPSSKARAIAQCFLRLSNVDPTLLDRVGSYEARLWRQAAQTIWTLEGMRRPQPALTRRPFRLPDRHFGRRETL
jgi:hypothetical protein